MFEVFSVISDEYGTRSNPTGQGAFLEVVAYDLMAEMQRQYPDCDFYVEWVAPQDWAHAY
jgi:hypothetical protein